MFGASLMRSTISRSSCGCPASRCRPRSSQRAADPDCLFVAHNAAFERAILRHILTPRYGWPTFRSNAGAAPWSCAPGAGAAGRAWQGRHGAGAAATESRQGDRAADGEAAAAARRRRPGRRVRTGSTTNRASARRYTPIASKTSKPSARCYRRLPPLSPAEQELWQLDQSINDRGFYCDGCLIEKAIAHHRGRRSRRASRNQTNNRR